MASITLKNLTKKWGEFVGVSALSLDIADGEFIVLLGPSGCGKTTTMRMIAGLEEVTGGEIWIGDRLVNDLEPKERDIAMVFQGYGLYPSMTVYENIRFPLKVRGVPESEQKIRVTRAAKMVELEDFMTRRPAELSGGQRQRVALARAIVREPTLFLMDEPLSNLDAKLRVSTRARIKNLHHELKTTTIYVTHDQIEAMTLADRVVVMNKGIVQQVGTPLDIYDYPANIFVAGFIGSPAMNLVRGEIKSGFFQAEGARIPAHKGFPMGPIIVGFRAEDASVEGACLQGKIYSLELLGDSAMVTLDLGHSLIVVKVAKDFRASIGDYLSVSLNPQRCQWFDAATGNRISNDHKETTR